MKDTPKWLGVDAVDGARVGSLELETFSIGGSHREKQANVWITLGNEIGRNESRIIRCPLSEVDARTREWLRSLAALLGPEEPRWIPCSERMPDGSRLVDVWIVGEERPAVCHLWPDRDAGDRWCDEVTDPCDNIIFYDLEQVSHWRERPSAPEPPR